MTKTTITISISNRECRGHRRRRGRRNNKIFPSPHNYQNPEYLRLMADVRETYSVTTCGLAPQIDEFLRKNQSTIALVNKALKMRTIVSQQSSIEVSTIFFHHYSFCI